MNWDETRTKIETKRSEMNRTKWNEPKSILTIMRMWRTFYRQQTTPFTRISRLHPISHTVFPRIESAASIFSHNLELRFLFEGGFYSRAASINASKLPIAIVINTGNLFLIASLTCSHVDLPILRSYVRHYDSVTEIVSEPGFRSWGTVFKLQQFVSRLPL